VGIHLVELFEPLPVEGPVVDGGAACSEKQNIRGTARHQEGGTLPDLVNEMVLKQTVGAQKSLSYSKYLD